MQLFTPAFRLGARYARTSCMEDAASSNESELNRKRIEIAGRGLEVNRHRH